MESLGTSMGIVEQLWHWWHWCGIGVALVGDAAGVKCSISVVEGGTVPSRFSATLPFCVQKYRFSHRSNFRDFITSIH